MDPHTTYALKVLYPKYTGIHFEVKTYFELVHFKRGGMVNNRSPSMIPAFNGRYLSLSDVPRRLLANLNIECANTPNSGLFTSCCGGPAESISPRLSNEIGQPEKKGTGIHRRNQSYPCAPSASAICKKAGARVEDLSTVLAPLC